MLDAMDNGWARKIAVESNDPFDAQEVGSVGLAKRLQKEVERRGREWGLMTQAERADVRAMAVDLGAIQPIRGCAGVVAVAT
jgi:hypothetical protein